MNPNTHSTHFFFCSSYKLANNQDDILGPLKQAYFVGNPSEFSNEPRITTLFGDENTLQSSKKMCRQGNCHSCDQPKTIARRYLFSQVTWLVVLKFDVCGLRGGRRKSIGRRFNLAATAAVNSLVKRKEQKRTTFVYAIRADWFMSHVRLPWPKLRHRVLQLCEVITPQI